MRTLVLAGIAALAVAAGVPAWGETITRFRGGELIGPCHDFLASVDRDLVQQGICVGQIWAAWVVAVTDAAVCIPPRGGLRIRPKITHKPGNGVTRARLVISPTILSSREGSGRGDSPHAGGHGVRR